MIEVMLHEGSWCIYVEKCEKGDLAPTIIGLLQRYEREKGDLKYRKNYAITFRVYS